jgi:hypothetical protein
MCRPCLFTAHVYRDDVTLDLGRYYIYGQARVVREIERHVREREEEMRKEQRGMTRAPSVILHHWWLGEAL